jgi:enoyl-CoA hydratase
MSMQSPTTSTVEDEIIVRRGGQLGHLILNRPRALNSLTHGMVDTVRSALEEWRYDDGIRTVLISGSGERGLCAGGDVVTLHRAVMGGEPAIVDNFSVAEYTMNAVIADFPKPYVAFMDGMVLGGGVGISAHGSHRIVTERTRLGMPETGIGFAPDVGSNWLLSRTPSRFGTHMALTGSHITGADAVALGLADYFVPSGTLPELAQALEETDADEAIGALAVTPPGGPILEYHRWIDACYKEDTAEAIVEALQADGDPAAAQAAAEIQAKSPTSVKVALAAVRRARHFDSVHDVLRQDYRVAYHLLRGHDMREGIRAQLVDKDRNPQWSPPTLKDVPTADVTAHFDPIDAEDLDLSSVNCP